MQVLFGKGQDLVSFTKKWFAKRDGDCGKLEFALQDFQILDVDFVFGRQLTQLFQKLVAFCRGEFNGARNAVYYSP